MATKTFDNNGGAGNGNWSAAVNWDPEGVPGTTDDVVLAANVNLDAAAFTLGVLEVLTITASSGYPNVYCNKATGTLRVPGGISNSGGGVPVIFIGGYDFTVEANLSSCAINTSNAAGTDWDFTLTGDCTDMMYLSISDSHLIDLTITGDVSMGAANIIYLIGKGTGSLVVNGDIGKDGSPWPLGDVNIGDETHSWTSVSITGNLWVKNLNLYGDAIVVVGNGRVQYIQRIACDALVWTGNLDCSSAYSIYGDTAFYGDIDFSNYINLGVGTHYFGGNITAKGTYDGALSPAATDCIGVGLGCQFQDDDVVLYVEGATQNCNLLVGGATDGHPNYAYVEQFWQRDGYTGGGAHKDFIGFGQYCEVEVGVPRRESIIHASCYYSFTVIGEFALNANRTYGYDV